ncbi:unnamed protein product [Ectocarpus sp. CCAP 1310/34]|nr:unnamed protein product [Ectocarpus sp. CCAP 1310/34]
MEEESEGGDDDDDNPFDIGHLSAPKFGSGNSMIPDDLVPQLMGLTVLEQQLISMAHPIARAYRLPGGQCAYSGHILNVARDVTTFATSLPWQANSDDIPIIVIVPPGGGTWQGREFKALKNCVEIALNWLIANNPAYSSVRIDIENLDRLGRENDDTEHDHVNNFLRLRKAGPPHGAGGGGGPSDDEDSSSTRRDYRYIGAPFPARPDDDVTDPLQAAGGRTTSNTPRESFIPTDGTGETPQEDEVRACLERLAARRDGGDASARVHHPRQLDPLPEHQTPFLATKCFPCLFPRGAADPTSGARRRGVDFVDHVTHLLKFVDAVEEERYHYRFVSHRLFAYWCMDTKVRSQARTQCRMFMNNNPHIAQMSVDEVFDNIWDNVQGIMTHMSRYTANLPGTDGFWQKEQGRLENAVDQLQSLTVFTTYSAADHHWYDLHRLMPGYKEDDDDKPTPQQRTQWLIDNPHLADWWFWQRLQEWKGVFLGRDMGDQRWQWDRAEWQSRASLHVHGCSSWIVEAVRNKHLTDLSRRYLKGFLARRRVKQGRLEEGAPTDGGVSDEEFARVQQEMCTFLVAVGFTARNPDPPAPDEAVSEEQRRAAAEGIARDMRDFPWEDEQATMERYSLLLNACQRYTR